MGGMGHFIKLFCLVKAPPPSSRGAGESPGWEQKGCQTDSYWPLSHVFSIKISKCIHFTLTANPTVFDHVVAV